MYNAYLGFYNARGCREKKGLSCRGKLEWVLLE